MPSLRQRVAAFPRRLATNPYCEQLYDHLEGLGIGVEDGRSGVRWLLAHRRSVRVLHFHWPERHFRHGRLASAVGFALRLLLARVLGYRLVWTVHNVVPHDGPTVGDRLVHAVLRRYARLVVHCAAGRAALGAAGPRATVIPHGSYVGYYPNVMTRETARARLDLPRDARVLLAFGQVRPYKGLEPLTEAFAALPHSHARLVIAGEPVGPFHPAADPRVHLVLRHVPDAELQVFFNAADLVVLPYRAVLTSGAAMLAFSFGRGIVAPRLGCLAELQSSGAAILYDPAEPDGLAAALAQAMDVDPGSLGMQARRLVRAQSWDVIARRHLAVYGFAPMLTLLQAGRASGRERRHTVWI